MSTNLIRTVLSVLAVAVMVASSLLGCTTDAAGVTTCTASWLSPQLAAMAASGFVILNLILKAFGQGGTPAQNLGAKAVVVVPAEKAGPGTVTASQVAAPAGAKK